MELNNNIVIKPAGGIIGEDFWEMEMKLDHISLKFLIKHEFIEQYGEPEIQGATWEADTLRIKFSTYQNTKQS